MSNNKPAKPVTGKPYQAMVFALLTLPYIALAGNPPSDASQPAAKTNLTKAQQEGKKLAFSRSKGNCLACHAIDNGDMAGTVGPKLVHAKQLFPKRRVLFQHIWDETQFNPQTPMPPFGKNLILTKAEINKIIDYLYTQ
jgi:sulfur-oxidizing protein SoxX